jgi:hypothetical protein
MRSGGCHFVFNWESSTWEVSCTYCGASVGFLYWISMAFVNQPSSNRYLIIIRNVNPIKVYSFAAISYFPGNLFLLFFQSIWFTDIAICTHPQLWVWDKTMPRHFQDFVKQSEGGLICLINQTARTVNGVTPTFIFLFLGCIYYMNSHHIISYYSSYFLFAFQE